MNQKVVLTGLFFIFVFLFGFWLSRSGKPYNTFIFTLHKLIGLAIGVFLIVTVYRVRQIAPFSLLETGVVGGTVLIFVSLVVAGGLLSVETAGGLRNVSHSLRGAISVIHKVFPYLAVLSTAATLYLLLIRKV